MVNSIGCFYSFARCAIVTAEILEDKKVLLKAKAFTHLGIEKLVQELRTYNLDSEIRTNKNETLNSAFSYRLNQTDFRDENSTDELLDLYKSLEDEGLLIIDNTVNMTQPHHKQAVYLALKQLNYYEYRNVFMADFGTMEVDCWY